MKGLYAFRDIIDSGARLTLGSDFPVEDMNPMGSFYAAITRTSLSGESPHGPAGWYANTTSRRWASFFISMPSMIIGSQTNVFLGWKHFEVQIAQSWF